MVRYLFLDDIRDPVHPYVDPSLPWEVYRDALTLYKSLSHDEDVVMSLDHDLGENIMGDLVPTGYDFLNWVEKDIAYGNIRFSSLDITVHSANPIGKRHMLMAIQSIHKIRNGG